MLKSPSAASCRERTPTVSTPATHDMRHARSALNEVYPGSPRRLSTHATSSPTHSRPACITYRFATQGRPLDSERNATHRRTADCVEVMKRERAIQNWHWADRKRERERERELEIDEFYRFRLSLSRERTDLKERCFDISMSEQVRAEP